MIIAITPLAFIAIISPHIFDMISLLLMPLRRHFHIIFTLASFRCCFSLRFSLKMMFQIEPASLEISHISRQPPPFCAVSRRCAKRLLLARRAQ
jgi:hypothetical protein